MRTSISLLFFLRQAWDPDALLQCLHLDTLLLQQQNTKKKYRIKNNCMHGQLGQVMDKSHRETKKTPLPLLKNQEQKQGTAPVPCTQHNLSSVQFSSVKSLSCPTL